MKDVRKSQWIKCWSEVLFLTSLLSAWDHVSHSGKDLVFPAQTKLPLASQAILLKAALNKSRFGLHHYLSFPQWAMVLCFNWHHVCQSFSHICYLAGLPRSFITCSWIFNDLIKSFEPNNDISTTNKLSDFTCFILAFIVITTKQLCTCGKQNQFYLEVYLMFYETKMNLCLIMCGLKMKAHKPSWGWDYRLFQQRKTDLKDPSF